MKALSLYAPYAALVADGAKKIEWRSWETSYRGQLLICSGAKKTKASENFLPFGYALCTVEIADCVPFSEKHLFDAYMSEMPEKSGFAWVLKNKKIIRPFPVKGKQRIFNLENAPIEYQEIDESDLLNYWVSLGIVERAKDI